MSVDLNLPESLDGSDIQRLIVNTLRHRYTTYDDSKYSLEDFIEVNSTISRKYPDLKLESQIQIARKLTKHHKDCLDDVISEHEILLSKLTGLADLRYRYGIGDIVLCKYDCVTRFAVVVAVSSDSITTGYRTSANKYTEHVFEGSEAHIKAKFISKAFSSES